MADENEKIEKTDRNDPSGRQAYTSDTARAQGGTVSQLDAKNVSQAQAVKQPQRRNAAPGEAVPPSGSFDPDNGGAEDTPAPKTIPPNDIGSLDPGQNFFSPQQPVVPYGPPKVTEPRWWDYPIGYNITYQPRSFEPIGFKQLRGMRDALGLLKTLIETRKDQLLRIPWSIEKIDDPSTPGEKPNDPRIKALQAFFKKPDRQTRWHAWCRLLLDDLLVTDAATIYVQPSKAGTPYACHVIDGATIKPLIDDYGRRPDPPFPAYQQVIKGLPIINLTSREIMYAPMHLRPDHRPYGNSPVEQVYMEILMSIQREVYQYNYYAEGTIPDLIVTCPKEWTPKQISDFQASFDYLLQGNLELKSKVRFLPGDSKPFEIRGGPLKQDYDEWLARILCFAFSISPTAFVRMMNRGTAQTSQEEALAEGLLPLMAWFKDEIMDPLIQEYWGYEDLEFTWQQEEQLDQLKQMQTITGFVKVGMITEDEGRERIGLGPKGGAADELVIITASGATKLEDAVAMASQNLQGQQQQQQIQGNQEQRNQEQHDQQMQVNNNTEDRAQEEHERAGETHDKEMKEPPPKPAATKKLDEPDGVKKKLTGRYGSSQLIRVKPRGLLKGSWKTY